MRSINYPVRINVPDNTRYIVKWTPTGGTTVDLANVYLNNHAISGVNFDYDTAPFLRDVISSDLITFPTNTNTLGQYEILPITGEITLARESDGRLYSGGLAGYDYNTEYRSEILDGTRNELIDNKVIPGQLMNFPIFIDSLGLPEVEFDIAVSVNGNIVYSQYLETQASNVSYWINTNLMALNDGDKIKVEVYNGPNVNTINLVAERPDPCHRYVVYYVNKYGSIDWLACTGRVDVSYTNNYYRINTGYDRLDPKTFQHRDINNAARRKFTVKTQILTDEGASRINNLLSAVRLWMHDLKDDVIYSCDVDTNNYTENRYYAKDAPNQNSFTLIQSQDLIRR